MPYRYDASLTYRRAAPSLTVDPTRYTDRLQAIKDKANFSKELALQEAASRRLAAETQRQEQEAAQAKAAADAVKSRVAKSQVKTSRLEADAARFAAANANVSGKYKAPPVGTNAASNKGAFRGNQGDGRVVAVGKMGERARDIINEALKYRGRWYQWGGSNPKTSFDCSGLVQWAYKSVGVALPRVSADQARSGRKVALSALRPGDLVAWDNSSRNNGADHIAIYIGNGQIIEAPRTGVQIRVRKLGNEQNAWGVQIL